MTDSRPKADTTLSTSRGCGVRTLEERVAEVERVNARLEDAALTTARALGEVSRHWSAVYEAMRRVETIDPETSSERDSAASAAPHV